MIPWEISINRQTDNPTGHSSDTTERWTIKRLLDWTAGYFRDQGFDQPRLDSEILLAEALKCRRIELYTRFDEEPPESIKGVFRDWVARHAEGEPVAYLVGHKEFFSLKFDVNSHVLIPRPETEHLVTEGLDAIKALGESGSIEIVDVGTGSGCVAIAIARHATDVRVTACDISEEALDVARRNALNHQLADRVRFVVSDLLESVDEPNSFDVIVSNPPYIGLDEKGDLDKSVVDFEPHQALFSNGPDGTETIQRLLQQAANRLKEGGRLVFEISPMIADRCRDMVTAIDGLKFERFVNDLAGLRRIVVARRTTG